eukprot:297135-Ditylum_brightwellii.AAC.1
MQSNFGLALPKKKAINTATSPTFNGKTSMYDAFKNSSHNSSNNSLEYKYTFCKAFETSIMVEEMIGFNRK